MRAILGIDANDNNKPIVYSPQDLVNPHVLITGKSGTGKTHLIRSMIRQMLGTATRHVRFYVLDVHDDINVPGASELLFSQNSPYGLNPLHIDPDPHFGGVRRAITNFLELMNITSSYKMGDRQSALIRALLTDLYRANGFYEDNPSSWRLDDGKHRQYAKKYPTVEDFYKFAQHKQKSLSYGRSKALDKYCRVLKKMHSQLLEHKYAEQEHKDNIDIDALKQSAKDEFAKMIDSLETGRELDDHQRYGKQDVMSSVIDRFGALTASGIFTGDMPPFDTSIPVWRYRIKPLTHSDSLMFVHTLLWQLYYKGLKQGEQDHVTDVIVLDETKRFQNDSIDNPVNIISTEGRKFGLCLIGAGQSHSHFSEDFASSVGTNIVLQQDDVFYDKLKRTYKLDVDTLNWLRPRSRAMVKLQSASSDVLSRYQKIVIDDNAIKQCLQQRSRSSQNAGTTPSRPSPQRAQQPPVASSAQPLNRERDESQSQTPRPAVKKLTQNIEPSSSITGASTQSSPTQEPSKSGAVLAKYLIDKADI